MNKEFIFVLSTIFVLSIIGFSQDSFAVGGTISDQTSCEAIGGTWTPDTPNIGINTCEINGVLSINSGELITIASDVFLKVTNTGQIEIIETSTVSGGLLNEGTLENDGNIKISGIFMSLRNKGTITNTASIENGGGGNGIINDVTGTINNIGTITNINSGRINSGGIIDNSGTITLSNSQITSGSSFINNFGSTLNNHGDIIIENSLYTGLSNLATFNNFGTINIISSSIDLGIFNRGSFNNLGTITVSNSDGVGIFNLLGTISNSGTITVSDSGSIYNLANIVNDDSINNSGIYKHVFPSASYSGIGTFDNTGTLAISGSIDSIVSLSTLNFPETLTDFTVLTDDTLTIHASSSLEIPADFSLIILGNIANSGLLNNNELIENYGTITVLGNSASLVNSKTLTNFASIVNNGGGSGIINDVTGTINNIGTITNINSGRINSGGIIDNSGTITLSNSQITSGSSFINNFGSTLNNHGDIIIENSMDTGLSNLATFNNFGTINIISSSIDLGIFNRGSFNNLGTITVSNSDGVGIFNHDLGTINNSGAIIILASGNIENNGIINIECGGTITGTINVNPPIDVCDTTPPVITLLGPNPLLLEVGDTYVEPGATVTDNSGEDLSDVLIIDSSDVDTSQIGTYFVTYDVTDSAGNAAIQVTRTVEVFNQVISSDISDNVVVNPGDSVIISNTAQVDGNVQIDGGTITIEEGSTVSGNIEGTNGASIVIEGGSTVDGNIDIVVSGTGSTLEIIDSNVGGNIETNNIDSLTIMNSDIAGNILSDGDGIVAITDNTINGNLEILNNASCTESANTVNGNNSGCP